MQDDNTPGNEPSNPFQLNLDEIKPADSSPAASPPSAQSPVEPEPPQPSQPVETPAPVEQTQVTEPQPTVGPPQVVAPPIEPPVEQPIEQPQVAAPQPVVESPQGVAVEPPVAPVVVPRPSSPEPVGKSFLDGLSSLFDGSERSIRILTRLGTVIVLLAVLFVSYRSTILDLVTTWENNIDYHHGFFVIPFTIYFLWARRNTFPERQSQREVLAGIVLGAVVLLFWAYCRYKVMAYSMVSLDSWTILPWVFAVCLMCFGTRVFRWALPTLLFLAFMFPWPHSIETQLRGPLQELAAKLSVYILRLCGEPAIAQANIVLMSDNQQLDVAAACSGIRVLVSIIAAAYAAVLLMRRPWWQNVLLFCLVVPIALMVNAFRIALTGLLIKHASDFIDGRGFEKPTPVVCDEISGMVMLILTFVFFVLIIWWFSKVFQRVEVSDHQTRIRQE